VAKDRMEMRKRNLHFWYWPKFLLNKFCKSRVSTQYKKHSLDSGKYQHFFINPNSVTTHKNCLWGNSNEWSQYWIWWRNENNIHPCNKNKLAISKALIWPLPYLGEYRDIILTLKVLNFQMDCSNFENTASRYEFVG